MIGGMEDTSSVRVIACCGGMVIVAGLERMTFEVLRSLSERGAAVHCIVNTWENHRIVALAEAIGASWSTGYYWYGFGRQLLNPWKLAQFLWDVLRTSMGLLKDAWRFRPTHILLPEFVSVLRNWPALLLLRYLGVKVILRLGNPPPQGRLYQLIWRWCIAPVLDRMVCNSQFTMRELVAYVGAIPKITCILNTVPTRQPDPEPKSEQVPNGPAKVVFVGQIIPGKGLDLLLEAIGLLVSRGYDLQLDVIGNIDDWESPSFKGYRLRMRERANQADLTGRINFLGWREDVPGLLTRGTIHCCPSMPDLREGFGLVTIEAKQAGIPSVVFPTGALPELISHGVDGWICSEVSASALAEGVEFFLRDPLRCKEAGAAARATVADCFSRGRFAAAWGGVFLE